MATAATSSKPKIYAALGKVMEGVGNIPKNGVGPAAKGSFPFVKIDDIIAKVHELLVQNKIILQPRLEIDREVDRSGSRVAISSVVSGELAFVSTEDGSEFVVRSVGEGQDLGSDTATRKAVTQFIKIALLNTFLIATGEADEEGYVDLNEARSQSKPAATKVAAAKRPSPEDELGAARRRVQAAAGKAGLPSGEVNQIGKDNGLNDPYNNVEEANKLADLLENLS